MTYVDGFVMAVPTENKQQFIEHARTGGEAFLELGATRLLECWADDVPDGSLTDFRKAVQGDRGRGRRLLLDRVARQGHARRRDEDDDERLERPAAQPGVEPDAVRQQADDLRRLCTRRRARQLTPDLGAEVG